MKTVKKPMLWNIAILTVILAVVLAVLSYAYEQVPATVVSILVLIYLCLVLACLINALYRQLKYNIYSYNVIYYTGFSVFVFLLLTSHELFTMKTVMDPGAYSALQVFTNLSESIVDFMAYSLVFVIAFAGVLIISNILLLRKEGGKTCLFCKYAGRHPADRDRMAVLQKTQCR